MRVDLRALIRCVLIVLGVLWTCAEAGRAEDSFAGAWQASSSAIDVAVDSWGKDCGPRPTSSRSTGGGNVSISAQGQALVIHSSRELRTDQCWSPNPAMQRVATTYSNGVWTTRCRTAPQDPREEAGVYTLKALGPDRLLYEDISHFNWKLNESTCNATITTTQTLIRRVTPTPASASSSSSGAQSAHATTVPAPSCSPGAPQRIVLRPRRADIELGAKVCFEARVLDASGCELGHPKVAWSLEHGKGIKAALENGCFSAGDSSAESEGTFVVVAAHMGLRGSAEVAVSASNLPSLLARRLQAGAVEGDDANAEPTAPTASSVPEARARSSVSVSVRAVAHTGHATRWVGVGVGALVVVVIGGLLLRRTRPHTSTGQSTPNTRTRRCPICGTEYPAQDAFCGNDGSALSPPT